MTRQDIINKIEYSIQADCDTRVHFSERAYRLPIVGKFVKLADHDELMGKRMIRYVTKGKMNSFILTKGVYFTRILNIEEVADVKMI